MTEALKICLIDTETVVGELRFTSERGRQSSSFTYNSAWRASPAAFALAPALRLQEAPHFFSAAAQNPALPHFLALPPVLADLCPDGWGRSLMRRDAREQGAIEPTDLHFLTLIDDATRLGALRVLDTHGIPLTTRNGISPVIPFDVQLPDLARAARSFEGRKALRDEWKDLLPGSGLGGARPKATLRDTHGCLWVAKFTSEKDENSAIERAEVMTNWLADACGITVPEARLFEIGRDNPVGLFKRFDRAGASHDLRLHYVSAQTFMDASTAIDSDVTYVKMAEAMMEAGLAGEQRQELFRRIVFQLLVNNTDDHLKNHGFLHVNGDWSLSPAFDINPQTDRRPQLKIAFDTDVGELPTPQEMVDRSFYFDLTDAQAAACISRMANTVATCWAPYAQAAKMRGPDLAAYRSLFEGPQQNAWLGAALELHVPQPPVVPQRESENAR